MLWLFAQPLKQDLRCRGFSLLGKFAMLQRSLWYCVLLCFTLVLERTIAKTKKRTDVFYTSIFANWFVLICPFISSRLHLPKKSFNFFGYNFTCFENS
jgi:hypothetical protein